MTTKSHKAVKHKEMKMNPFWKNALTSFIIWTVITASFFAAIFGGFYLINGQPHKQVSALSASWEAPFELKMGFEPPMQYTFHDYDACAAANLTPVSSAMLVNGHIVVFDKYVVTPSKNGQVEVTSIYRINVYILDNMNNRYLLLKTPSQDEKWSGYIFLFSQSMNATETKYIYMEDATALPQCK